MASGHCGTEYQHDLGRFSSITHRDRAASRTHTRPRWIMVGCEGRLDASGLALRRHDHSIKLSTFMVKPVHSLVFMRIYQEPKRLTITKGFVATKRS